MSCVVSHELDQHFDCQGFHLAIREALVIGFGRGFLFGNRGFPRQLPVNRRVAPKLTLSFEN
jgi:hypothetical protein